MLHKEKRHTIYKCAPSYLWENTGTELLLFTPFYFCINKSIVVNLIKLLKNPPVYFAVNKSIVVQIRKLLKNPPVYFAVNKSIVVQQKKSVLQVANG